MKSDNPLPTARLFRFNVPGTEHMLAAPFEQLAGVANLPFLTPIPAMPEAILGLSRWQELPVVVIDMQRVLCPDVVPAMQQDALAYHAMVLKIVFENQVNLVACPILAGGQSVSVPLSLPRAEMPGGIVPEAVHQAVLIGEKRVLLLDTLRLPELLAADAVTA